MSDAINRLIQQQNKAEQTINRIQRWISFRQGSNLFYLDESHQEFYRIKRSKIDRAEHEYNLLKELYEFIEKQKSSFNSSANSKELLSVPEPPKSADITT